MKAFATSNSWLLKGGGGLKVMMGRHNQYNFPTRPSIQQQNLPPNSLIGMPTTFHFSHPVHNAFFANFDPSIFASPHWIGGFTSTKWLSARKRADFELHSPPFLFFYFVASIPTRTKKKGPVFIINCLFKASVIVAAAWNTTQWGLVYQSCPICLCVVINLGSGAGKKRSLRPAGNCHCTARVSAVEWPVCLKTIWSSRQSRNRGFICLPVGVSSESWFHCCVSWLGFWLHSSAPYCWLSFISDKS